MPRNCTINATYTGPNCLGDMVIELECQRRGVFTFCLSPGSKCLTLEEDDSPTPVQPPIPAEPVQPVACSAPASPGLPDETWPKEQLQKYCVVNRIAFHHLNSEKTLLGLIEKKRATPA